MGMSSVCLTNSFTTSESLHSYFHIIVVLGLMLCRFHPFADKVGVLVHKGDDAVVMFGVLVA